LTREVGPQKVPDLTTVWHCYNTNNKNIKVLKCVIPKFSFIVVPERRGDLTLESYSDIHLVN